VIAPPSRIFLRLPNWLGDLVMATPAIRAVRRHWPAARIVGGIRRYGAPVLAGLRTLDEIWQLDRAEEKVGFGLRGYARRLREGRFDLAVFFTNSFTSALGPALARIPRRAGYEGDWRGPLLTDRAPRGDRRRPVPMPRYYLDLVSTLGVPPDGDHYDVPVRAEDRAEVARILAELGIDPAKPLAALNPGAKFGSSKLWDPAKFAAIGDRLARERGFQVAILCAPDETAIARAIVDRMRERVFSTHDRIVPIPALRAFVERLSLLVTTDTGTRHLAVGLSVPSVVVMGSTHPGWTDWLMTRSRVVRRDVPCGPCHLKACPLDHACMGLVGVEDVWAGVKAVLSQDRGRSASANSHGSSQQ
jgi:heptosyltransferase-2